MLLFQSFEYLIWEWATFGHYEAVALKLELASIYQL